jgi:ABC-type nitrate/sulfonate/bicarbonate transport system substrate-binding protein
VGYVGLTDAAPLIVAQELGHAEREGLHLRLSREVGWATVRDKLLNRELDAVHAPAPLLWACRLGLGGLAFPVCTALVLNRNGNAVCLSNRLRSYGVKDLPTLRKEALRRRGEHKLVFGIVYPFSTHNLHLRAWLRQAGLVPERDVRLAVVPPAQMLAALNAGAIDGFMAGEPWTSLAVARGRGWCPTWSGALFPGHIEKVLMVRDEFAESAAHAALLRAVSTAGAWCDEGSNRRELAALLSKKEHLDVPEEALLPALCGPFVFDEERRETLPDMLIFHNGGAQIPSTERALELQRELISAGLLEPSLPADYCHQLFREELHAGALGLSPATAELA